MRFLDLDLAQRIPDAKTIWLYRETLAKASVLEACSSNLTSIGLLRDSNREGAKWGQLVDAPLVPVPKQPNTRVEDAAIKAGERRLIRPNVA